MKNRVEYDVTQSFCLHLRALKMKTKMRHLKFLMFALMLTMGFSLASCLDSDDDNAGSTGTAIGKLHYHFAGSYYFQTADGCTITPSYSSVSTALSNGTDLSQFVGQVLYFGYDTTDATWDETQTTLSNVNFTGCVPLSHPVEVVYGTAADQALNDSIENTPVISLSSYGDSPAFMFDQFTLYIPANYVMAKTENYLTLVYYTDEPEDNDGVMRLHLRYNSTGTTLTTTVSSYEYYAYNLSFYLNFFDLTEAFQAYMAQNGLSSYPTTVEIVANENPYSLNLDDSQTAERVYTVEYSLGE